MDGEEEEVVDPDAIRRRLAERKRLLRQRSLLLELLQNDADMEKTRFFDAVMPRDESSFFSFLEAEGPAEEPWPEMESLVSMVEEPKVGVDPKDEPTYGNGSRSPRRRIVDNSVEKIQEHQPKETSQTLTAKPNTIKCGPSHPTSHSQDINESIGGSRASPSFRFSSGLQKSKSPGESQQRPKTFSPAALQAKRLSFDKSAALTSQLEDQMPTSTVRIRLQDLSKSLSTDMEMFRKDLASGCTKLERSLKTRDSDDSKSNGVDSSSPAKIKKFLSQSVDDGASLKRRVPYRGYLDPTLASTARISDLKQHYQRRASAFNEDKVQNKKPVPERILKPTLSWTAHVNYNEENSRKETIVNTTSEPFPPEVEERLSRHTESSKLREAGREEEKRLAEEKKDRQARPLSPQASNFYSKLSQSTTENEKHKKELLSSSFWSEADTADFLASSTRERSPHSEASSRPRNNLDNNIDDFHPAEFEREMDELFNQAFLVPDYVLRKRERKDGKKPKKMLSAMSEGTKNWGQNWGVREHPSGIWVGPDNGILRSETAVDEPARTFISKNSREILRTTRKVGFKEHAEIWSENLKKFREEEKCAPSDEKPALPYHNFSGQLDKLRSKLEKERRHESKEVSELVALLASLPNGYRERVEGMIDSLPSTSTESMSWEQKQLLNEHDRIRGDDFESNKDTESASSSCPKKMQPVVKDLYHPKSVDEHVSRLRGARQEQETIAKNWEDIVTAKSWTPNPTICKPFRLSGRPEIPASLIAASVYAGLLCSSTKQDKPKRKKKKKKTKANTQARQGVHSLERNPSDEHRMAFSDPNPALNCSTINGTSFLSHRMMGKSGWFSSGTYQKYTDTIIQDGDRLREEELLSDQTVTDSSTTDSTTSVGSSFSGSSQNSLTAGVSNQSDESGDENNSPLRSSYKVQSGPLFRSKDDIVAYLSTVGAGTTM